MIERKTGCCVYQHLKDFTVVDLETTGCNPVEDEIIELGALKVRDGKVVATYDQLIKPFFPIQPFTTGLTGITNEMVQNAPPIEDKILSFVEFIGDDVVVGHNVIFDVNFTYDALIRFRRKEFSNDYIDTLRLSRRALPKLPHHRLCDLVDYFQIDCGPAHRALADCYGALGLYHRLWEIIEEQHIEFKVPKKKKKTSRKEG